MTQLDEKPNLIWIQSGFIGDIILFTACLRLVNEYYPKVKQFVITNPLGIEILSNWPNIEVVSYDKKLGTIKSFLEVKAKISEFSMDPKRTVCLLGHRSFRSALLAKYLGFKTITYQESSLSFLAQVKIPRIAVFPEAVRQALLLEPLGLDRNACLRARPYLPQGKELLSSDFDFLVGKNSKTKIIAIAPGSKWGTKKWPGERYRKLTELLLDHKNHQVITIGSKEEAKVFKNLFCGFEGHPRFKNLFGKTSLQALASLYPNLDLLVTNDSSPIHFASAFNTPTVAIFGATIPAMGFAPLAEKFSVVENKALDCRPCSFHGPQTCPKSHFQCMQSLSVSEVFTKSLNLLRG